MKLTKNKIIFTALVVMFAMLSCFVLQKFGVFAAMNFSKKTTAAYAQNNSNQDDDYMDGYFMGNIEAFRAYLLDELEIELDFETDDEAVLAIFEALGYDETEQSITLAEERYMEIYYDALFAEVIEFHPYDFLLIETDEQSLIQPMF